MKKLFALLAVTLASLSFAQADETTYVTVGDGIAKKWEFRGELAHSTDFKGNDGMNTTGGDDNVVFHIGAGYNFDSNKYFGLATGYYPSWGGGRAANKYVPLLGDFVYRWNLTNPRWSVYAQARGGYLFSVKKDGVIDGQNYEHPDGLYFDIQPGVYYRLLPNIDIHFSVGYGFFRPNEDTPDCMYNEHLLVTSLGMNFRSAPKMPIRTTPIEEPVAEPEPQKPEIVTPEPEPVKIVETTTEEQRQLGEREVVIFYIIRKHNILPEKDALLEEMAEFTKTHKTSKIIVKSYADKGTGNYKLNQMYSRNRMNEVVKHLVEQYGISRDQIEASYYGDTVQPYEENDLNRCSIIVVKEIE